LEETLISADSGKHKFIMEKVIVVEEISPLWLMLIRFYRLLRYKIFYIRATQKVKRSAAFKGACDKGIIQQIDLNQRITSFCGMNTDEAFDNINELYKIFVKDQLILKAKELYADDNIELAFKKVLNEKLARFYYLDDMLFQLREKFPQAKLFVIPSNGTERVRSAGDEAYFYLCTRRILQENSLKYKHNGRCPFPKLLIALSFISWQREAALLYSKAAALQLWFTARFLLGFFFPVKAARKDFRYAVMLINPGVQFANKVQKVDFLVDDALILRKDVIFISEHKLKKEFRKYMDDNKLFFVDDIYANIGPKAISELFGFLSLLFMKKPSFLPIMEAYLKLIFIYAAWKGFCQNYKIANLVAFNDVGIKSIGRNVILKNENPAMRAWHYEHSISHRIFAATADKPLMSLRYHSIGFIFYDYYIIWSDLLTQYFRNHLQHIKEYITVGCLWAEHTANIAKGMIASRILDIGKIKAAAGNYKFVSVFDTTFGDDLMQGYDEGREFFKHVESLLKDLSDIFVIFKPKKTRRSMVKFCPEILDAYDGFSSHKRCCVLPEYISPSEVIAFSDLIVAVPFTSPAFEALCARKKAIYYDVFDKYRGSILDQVPGLVIHDYQNFTKRVKELLFETDEEAYNKYLDTQAKGKIEPFFDGMAVTRFRKLLSR